MIIIRSTKVCINHALVVTGTHDTIHDLLLSILIKNPDMTVNNVKMGIENGIALILDGFNHSNNSLTNTQYLNRAKAFIAHFIKKEYVEAILV